MPKFSIVLTAYNESANITASLNKILTFMRGFTDSFEVIVNDDGSDDNTVDLVNAFKVDNPEIVLLENPHRGKGAGIWSGFDYASGDYILLTDVDLATPIEELKKMLVWIEEHGYDLVIGSREGVGARRVGEPFYRHFIGRVFNWWVRVIALPGIQDSQCGFKLFTYKAAKDIFSRLRLYGRDAPEVKGALFGAFDVEVLYIAKKLGYKIKNVPVLWTYVVTDRLNLFQNSYRMALDVIKVRLNDLKGAYTPKLP